MKIEMEAELIDGIRGNVQTLRNMWSLKIKDTEKILGSVYAQQQDQHRCRSLKKNSSSVSYSSSRFLDQNPLIVVENHEGKTCDTNLKS